MSRLGRFYGGWRPTPEKDRPQAANLTGLKEKLPAQIDPRPELPPVFDQGQLGSCTANATAAAFQYDGILDGQNPGGLSRLWIYFQERKLEGELGQGDTGAIGSDAFKVASTIGIPPEADWPYDINTYQGPVPDRATRDEGHYKLVKPYHAVSPSETALKRVLANGQTVAFGFQVYSSFESGEVERTGIVPMPDPSTEQLLGGHEVLLVGYLKAQPEYGLVRNSWGPTWGDGGYCLMPWKLLTSRKLAGDWTTIVRSVQT